MTTGFRATDREIAHEEQPLKEGAIELGVVTKGNADSPYSHGDSDVNDGNTLVQVRLLRGLTGEDGRLIWCRLNLALPKLPKDGDQVMVGVPAGYGYSVGCPAILAVLGPNPEPQPGLRPDDPVMLGPKRNFVRCDSEGRVSLFTTDDGTPTGKSVYFQVRPDGFRGVHPLFKFTLDKTGFHVVHASGARVDLGAVSGMPAPLDVLNSYAKLSAAMVQIEGSAISMGTATGTPDNVARATPTLANLDAIQAALVALVDVFAAMVVEIGAFAAPPTLPITGAHMAALSAGITDALTTSVTPALAALTAALSAAHATLPSNSTTTT